MLLLDNLLLAPGSAVMKIFEELAKKAQEEFLDDGAVKKELQEIYARLEAGTLSEIDFTSREEELLQRLEQIARARFQLPEAAPLPEQELAALELPVIDVPAIELPSLELPAFEPAAPAPLPPPDPIPVAPAMPATRETSVAPARLTPQQVVECALSGLAMLKMRVSTVSAVTKAAHGWQVIAELVESRAVPDTSDLLGVYEVQLDEGGAILGYVRTRMRRRCDLGAGR